MSATQNEVTALPATPQSSKKRKLASETPEKSTKKKRKHAKVEDDTLASQESASSKKDKKGDKKSSRSKEIDVAVETIPELQETHDVELPDAPTESTSPIAEQASGNETAEGTDLADVAGEVEEQDNELLQSEAPSCFYEKRLSLQVSIPAVSLASTTSSILALHLAPLLLTYFPPAEGIVLSFSDPVLSAKPSHGVNLPLKAPEIGEIPRHPADETFAKCADAFGVCWVWLTATFMVFRPQARDELRGWTNVSSEGFIGLVSYNYFQTAIGKSRIPKDWTWDGPTRAGNSKKRTRKEKLRDEDDTIASQEETVDSQGTAHNEVAQGGSSSFMDSTGNSIPAKQTFHVVDVEMVPGHEKDKWTLQIEGSLLSPAEEATVVAEERRRFEQAHRSRTRSKTPGSEAGEMPLMSGALPFSQVASP